MAHWETVAPKTNIYIYIYIYIFILQEFVAFRLGLKCPDPGILNTGISVNFSSAQIPVLKQKMPIVQY